jgi:Kef-type K+ transport system membrane component KefB
MRHSVARVPPAPGRELINLSASGQPNSSAVRWLSGAPGQATSIWGETHLLGGFAAGVIVRYTLGRREVPVFESKLTAVAFGAFVPFFFVVSGMRLDLPALFASVGSVAKMVLFFVLFLVVRGTPALLLYRSVLVRRDRFALALMCSTQLPLVLAITALATASGHMRSSTAAALVGGAVLSTLFYPFLGLRLRGDLTADRVPSAP